MTTTNLPPVHQNRPNGDRERIAYRRRFVLGLKRDGHSVDEITDLWNAHCEENEREDEKRQRVTISTDIKHSLASLVDETRLLAAEYRELLTARLEKAISAPGFVRQIEAGNPLYVDRLVKVVTQLAQMHGANAPTKIAQTDVEGHDVQQGLSDDERARLVRELLEKAQARKDEVEE